MTILSIVLLTIWLMLFGAIQSGWVTMLPHTFGVLTFIIGLAILLLELFFFGRGRNWFK